MPVDALIEYPCDFPVKILGHRESGFAQAIVEIVRHHVPDFDAATVEMRSSKHGKYLSVTCVIRAGSRDQLDDLYRALCDHPMVVMVL